MIDPPALRIWDSFGHIDADGTLRIISMVASKENSDPKTQHFHAPLWQFKLTHEGWKDMGVLFTPGPDKSNWSGTSRTINGQIDGVPQEIELLLYTVLGKPGEEVPDYEFPQGLKFVILKPTADGGLEAVRGKQPVEFNPLNEKTFKRFLGLGCMFGSIENYGGPELDSGNPLAVENNQRSTIPLHRDPDLIQLPTGEYALKEGCVEILPPIPLPFIPEQKHIAQKFIQPTQLECANVFQVGDRWFVIGNTSTSIREGVDLAYAYDDQRYAHLFELKGDKLEFIKTLSDEVNMWSQKVRIYGMEVLFVLDNKVFVQCFNRDDLEQGLPPVCTLDLTYPEECFELRPVRPEDLFNYVYEYYNKGKQKLGVERKEEVRV